MPEGSDWFQRLVGFHEDGYAQTQARLEAVDTRLHSRVNGASYAVGSLDTPTLAALRERTRQPGAALTGPLRVTNVQADVHRLHLEPGNAHALFQVASQFNLLEMAGPDVTPEDGVTRYADDRTQGPACAIAAGAATIYRNYLAPVGSGTGQTSRRQIDTLSELGEALGNGNGNDAGALWAMRNGYALCSSAGLAAIDRRLQQAAPEELDHLRGLLRIGFHAGVEVTAGALPGHCVSQVFCSALPVAYTALEPQRFERFATLVLEAAYEATLRAAVLNAQRTGCRLVYLTLLGGGAFGNDSRWILSALRRALHLFADTALEVRLVSHGRVSSKLQALESLGASR